MQNLQKHTAASVTLPDLIKRFPNEWRQVKSDTSAAIKEKTPEQLSDYLIETKKTLDSSMRAMAHGRKSSGKMTTAMTNAVKAQMTFLTLEQYCRAALAGRVAKSGQLRRFDQLIAQNLFFTRSRERRAVSVRWFKIWWRLIQDKPAVMSLIQSMGIYCVYSKDLIASLARLIENRRCLDLGAGDGTLSLLLHRAGVKVDAVDDQSWSHKVQFPDWVEKLDARSALQKFQPAVVMCSWPPPGNVFEEQIFTTASVQMYIAILSKHRFASGDWSAYERQKNFSWAIDEELSSQVLPDELQNIVLVFKRKNPKATS